VDNRFVRNRSTSPGAGSEPSLLYLGVSGNATGELTDNSFAANVALEGAPAPTAAALVFVSGFGSSPFVGRVVARRNNLQDNLGPGPDAPQLALRLRGGEVELTDGLVVRGDGGGVRVDAASGSGGGSTAFLTNLTVTAHPGFGLQRVPGDGQVFLSNTVLYGNGSDLVGSVDQLANLVSVDPRFLDPSRDYRLRLDSPGIDTGDLGAPGGLGPLDILGGPRVLGTSVDVGAFEAESGSGGDGTCRALWPIVDRSTPACRCATDPALRALRCAFFGPEIFAVLRTRLPGPGGRPFEAEWGLLSWTPVVGRYQMDAAMLVEGQWVKQAWLGPTQPVLKEGELVKEPFVLEASSEEPTWLRTRLRYRPRGQKPVVAQFEVLLPASAKQPGKQDQP
jgi:hypothetical protein